MENHSQRNVRVNTTATRFANAFHNLHRAFDPTYSSYLNV